MENKNKENLSFFNKWAKIYDWRIFKYWMSGFQNAILKEINFSKKSKILDISCGTGELLFKLDKESNKNELYGIDLSNEMLNVARNKLPSQIKLQKMDVHNLNFKNNYFDYVICTEAFHHFYNQKKALLEMKRITKKGGQVIVVDINFFLKIIHDLLCFLEPGCQKVNNKNEFKELFENTGLKDIIQKRSFLFAIMTLGVKR